MHELNSSFSLEFLVSRWNRQKKMQTDGNPFIQCNCLFSYKNLKMWYMEMTLEVMEPKLSCHTSGNWSPKRWHGLFKVTQERNDRAGTGSHESSHNSSHPWCVGKRQAQPLSQRTTFQLYILVLPKYLSFFEKRKGGGNKLIKLFIANPLEPFKQMGLQDNLDICKIFKITDQLLVKWHNISKTTNYFFQVPASCSSNLTKDNYQINIPKAVLIMSLSYARTSGGSPLPTKLNTKSSH